MKSPTSSKRRRVVDGQVQKLCRRCDQWKPLNLLTPSKACHDGRCSTCLDCTRLVKKTWDAQESRPLRVRELGEIIRRTA